MKVNLIRVINESVGSSTYDSKVKAELSRGINDPSLANIIAQWAIDAHNKDELGDVECVDWGHGKGNSGVALIKATFTGDSSRVRQLNQLSKLVNKPGQFVEYREDINGLPPFMAMGYYHQFSVAYGFTPRPELGDRSAQPSHDSRGFDENEELFAQYMVGDPSYHHVDENSYGLDLWATHDSSTGEFANGILGGTGKTEVTSRSAKMDYGLDKLINNPNKWVRAEVAQKGYRLDKLINDPNEWVRAEVAKKGYRLDKLINDEHWMVRKAVANQGYGLDKLINDPSEWVRAIVAEQGYGLDKLVNDPEETVRARVAEHGYGLDKLINDPNEYIRRVVAEHGYGLDILVNDNSWDVRMAVAEQGYGLDILVNDPDSYVRRAAMDKLSRKGK